MLLANCSGRNRGLPPTRLSPARFRRGDLSARAHLGGDAFRMHDLGQLGQVFGPLDQEGVSPSLKSRGSFAFFQTIAHVETCTQTVEVGAIDLA